MDWADGVTYAVHDLEDFVRAQHIPIARSFKTLESARTSSTLRGDVSGVIGRSLLMGWQLRGRMASRSRPRNRGSGIAPALIPGGRRHGVARPRGLLSSRTVASMLPRRVWFSTRRSYMNFTSQRLPERLPERYSRSHHAPRGQARPCNSVVTVARCRLGWSRCLIPCVLSRPTLS